MNVVCSDTEADDNKEPKLGVFDSGAFALKHFSKLVSATLMQRLVR